MIKIEQKLTITLASIIVGIFASIGALTQIMQQLLASFQGSIMTLLYLVVIIFIILIGFVFQKNKYFSRNKCVFFISFLLVIYYEFTSVFLGPPLTEIQFFIVFTIIAFMVPSIIAVDEVIFMRTVIYLSILGLPFVNAIFVFDYNGAISMGNSYAFLFPVMTIIVYITHYFNSDFWYFKILDIVALVANAVYFFMMIAFGSRGPIVCILCYLAYRLIITETPSYIRIRKGRFVLFMILGIVFLLNFIPILVFISDVIESVFGVNLNFIDKFIRMNYDGDLSNGRESIIEDTIKGVLDSPVFGHGCDLYHMNHIDIYPHNFILQMFYDMGIVISLIFLFVLIRKFLRHIQLCFNKDKYILMILLCFASVPGALFSADLWSNVVLWLFFGCIFSNTFSYSANIVKYK